MSAPDHYQAIVIGSGQGGTPLSIALAKAGLRTALIERKHVGGTCANEGCSPTKTMVGSARVAGLARRAADYGVQTGPIRMDMERVRQRKRDIVDAAVLGLVGGEVMSMLQLAMMGGLDYMRLRNAIFAHPTIAESLNNLFKHFDE